MRALGCCRWTLAVALLSCAAPDVTRVEMCPSPETRPPRPAPECFHSVESRRYVGRLGELIGDTLSGWRSHPGAAELTATFGGGGRVDSLCFDSVSGAVVARRIPDVAERLRELPAAPACFAGHRLDFAWESDVATSEDVREVVRACHRAIRPLTREIDWCRTAQHCPLTEVLDLRSEADRELRSCVLASVPLAMRTGVSREVLSFVPVPGGKPDPELAIRAHHVCDGLPRRADVVACMDRHGWRPGR
jgi:hypothetical protein